MGPKTRTTCNIYIYIVCFCPTIYFARICTGYSRSRTTSGEGQSRIHSYISSILIECVKLILFLCREQYRYQIVLNKKLPYNCHCFFFPVKLTIPSIHLVSLISFLPQSLHPQSILQTSLPITSRAFGLSYSSCNVKSVTCPPQ